MTFTSPRTYLPSYDYSRPQPTSSFHSAWFLSSCPDSAHFSVTDSLPQPSLTQVTNVTLTGVRTCLWVQGSRSEFSWQLLTAVLLLVCWKGQNAKSLEKVLRIRESVQSPEFPEFFQNGSEKSRVPENSGVTISSRRSQEV